MTTTDRLSLGEGQTPVLELSALASQCGLSELCAQPEGCAPIARYLADLLARREGVFVEPASALAVAAIMHDVRAGRLTTADRPLAVLTGTGLRDLRRFAPRAGLPDAPMTVGDLRGLLASSLGRAHSP